MVLPVLTDESTLLGEQLSPEGIWIWSAVAQDQLQAQMETRRILSPAIPWFLCSDGSGRSLLGQEFEQKWWSYLCSQVCQHSWETGSLTVVFGYEEL